jgi:hypothetical protein
LAEESVLTDEFIRQLISVGEVDLLVGLPTHNNATTVGQVVQSIQAGIVKSFPRERAVILNVDGGSRDGTPDIVTGSSIDERRPYNAYTLRTLPSISTRYGSSPSSETALRTILAAAELLRAKACAVISAESTNIDADWAVRLLRPIYHDSFDFVAPIYRRHKFEGVLVSNLVYPMTRALYGQRIREPFATDFGFSGRVASQFLAQHAWTRDPGRLGTELELTLSTITGGCRICQSFLGTKSRTEQHADDLVAALRQTVGVLFSSLETNFAFWSANNSSKPVPTMGAEGEMTLDPVRVNRKRLKQMFSSGVAELEPVLRSILSASTLSELQRIAGLDDDNFRYPAELWVKTVYEFAASHHKSVISRDHIVQALAPLYRGRMFTFLVENRSGSAEDVENHIETLCNEFERRKPYLLELWNGGK